MDNDATEEMRRFEDLGRKLFQAPKESIEEADEPDDNTIREEPDDE